MKKTLFAIALVITMGITASAQSDVFFKWNSTYDENFREDDNVNLVLPNIHGSGNDQNATPLSSGLLVLTALGAGYTMIRRRREN